MMFSIQQKRDIADAVQRILQATHHPELPPDSGEISFNLHVDGAAAWSFADIRNNGAVGAPDMNPHNELMASIPEQEARDLIETSKMMFDARSPDELMKEMLTGEINLLRDRLNALVKAVEGFAQTTEKLQRNISRLEDRDKIKDRLYSELTTVVDRLHTFLKPIIEDNLIQHHDDQIRNLMTAVNQFTGKT